MSKTLKLTTILLLLIAGYWTFPFVWGASSASEGSFEALEEAVSPHLTDHPSWWLESGAKLLGNKDGWRTIQGELLAEDKWRKHYLRANPMDTDNGYHPQNIFRMLSKESFNEPKQELRFIVNNTNMSESPNRNSSSGAFLYARYINVDNYYYAGIQSDGKAVIRKKFNGTFKTLSEKQIFPGEYDKDLLPNLIPHGENIGLRVNLMETDSGLNIEVSLSKGPNEWEVILTTEDTGFMHGEVIGPGRVGIKTDFMDVSFTNYLVTD